MLDKSLTLLELTPVQGHATNGKVERAIQELKKITKSLMHQVGLTSLMKELTPLAAASAAQSLDLWPHTSNPNNMSRREARTGQKGSITDLTPFFCATAYYRKEDDKRGARIGLAVARILSPTGSVISHDILDLKTMKVHNVRTAKFNERLSEYKSASTRIANIMNAEVVHGPRPLEPTLEQIQTTDTSPSRNHYNDARYDTKYNKFYKIELFNKLGRFVCVYCNAPFNSQGTLRTHFSGDACTYNLKTRHKYEPTNIPAIITNKRNVVEEQTENTILCEYCNNELAGPTPTGRTSLATKKHIEKCKEQHHDKTIKDRAREAKKEKDKQKAAARTAATIEKHGKNNRSMRSKITKITAMMINTIIDKPQAMNYTVLNDELHIQMDNNKETKHESKEYSNNDPSPQYKPQAIGIRILDIINKQNIMDPNLLNEGHHMTLKIDRPSTLLLNPLLSEGFNTTSPLHLDHMESYNTFETQKDTDGKVKIKNLTIPGITLGTSKSFTPHKSKEVAGHPLEDYWREAEAVEYKQLVDTGTIIVIPETESRNHTRPIGSMMIYKIKFKDDGKTIDKFKCRLVALGFMEIAGRHFNPDACSAPVARGSTFMVLIAAAVEHNLLLKQADVKGAYLISEIDKDISIRLPNDTRLHSVKKGLYGLKQAGYLWNVKFTSVLIDIGFTVSKNDRCLYTFYRTNKSGEVEKCWIAIWVDDILAAVSSEELWNELFSKLDKECPSVQGELKWLLGMKITETNNSGEGRRIYISQESKITGLLENLGLTDCNSVRTPLPTSASLPDATNCPRTNKDEKETIVGLPFKSYAAFRTNYREILGFLAHIAEYGRPDIMQAVHFLARFQAYPSKDQYALVKRIVRYCKGTKDLSMIFGNREHPYHDTLVGHVDSDFAGCKDSSKSTTGSIFLVYGAAVEVKSGKQKCVTKSSTEAELVAASQSVCTALYLKRIIEDDLKIPVGKVPIYEDNEACITIAKNGTSHSRTRHIRVADAWIYQEVHDHKTIDIRSINTNDNIADMFTKSLPKAAFERHRNMLMGYNKTSAFIAGNKRSWNKDLISGKVYSLN